MFLARWLVVSVVFLGIAQAAGLSKPVSVTLHSKWPHTPLLLEARWVVSHVGPWWPVAWLLRSTLAFPLCHDPLARSEFVFTEDPLLFWRFVEGTKRVQTGATARGWTLGFHARRVGALVDKTSLFCSCL